MHASSIKPADAKRIGNALRPGLDYLRRLRERMVAVPGPVVGGAACRYRDPDFQAWYLRWVPAARSSVLQWLVTGYNASTWVSGRTKGDLVSMRYQPGKQDVDIASRAFLRMSIGGDNHA